MTEKTTNIEIRGLKKADALTALIRNGFSFEEATKYYTENKAGGSGFTAKYFARLRESGLGEEEFAEIIAAGSDNVKRNVKRLDAIRVLANDIREAAKAPARKTAAK